MTQETLTHISECQAPEIRLIPDSSSLSSPIQILRSRDFYILSVVKLNCHRSLATNSRWIIKNGNDTIASDRLETTSNELAIPSATLPYGDYQLNLTVTMTDDPRWASSRSAYIQIIPSGIVVNLVPLGTSMITIGHQQDLRLDPGNHSIDPDGYPFNASVSDSLKSNTTR